MNTGKMLIFLTNQTALPALTICALYKGRWHVELFFKLIKPASSDQAVLWDLRERREVSDLDRSQHLRAHRGHQEAPQPRRFALYLATDSFGHLVREDALPSTIRLSAETILGVISPFSMTKCTFV